MGGGRVPGSVGVADGRGHVAGRDPTGVADDRSFEQFRQAVLEAQIARKRSQHKPYFPAVPADDLEEVEAGYLMRKAAAAKCRELLVAARTALEAERASDPRAKKTRSIGVCSAYRDYAYDSTKWFETFQKHYDLMRKAGEYAGHEHGTRAERYMLITMLPLKAPPGFSNHSNGTAVDFKTSYDGTVYVADSLQLDRWPNTWLHHWLEKNAITFQFHPLSSEPWHWDFS